MFSQACVKNPVQGGRYTPPGQADIPPGQTPSADPTRADTPQADTPRIDTPQADTPSWPGRQPPRQTTTPANGMHPTGMHSYSLLYPASLMLGQISNFGLDTQIHGNDVLKHIF